MNDELSSREKERACLCFCNYNRAVSAGEISRHGDASLQVAHASARDEIYNEPHIRQLRSGSAIKISGAVLSRVSVSRNASRGEQSASEKSS